MDDQRLPRKFLFGWVRNARPVGRPEKTFGQRAHELIDCAIEVQSPMIQQRIRDIGWVAYAQNVDDWERFSDSCPKRYLYGTPRRKRNVVNEFGKDLMFQHRNKRNEPVFNPHRIYRYQE